MAQAQADAALALALDFAAALDSAFVLRSSSTQTRSIVLSFELCAMRRVRLRCSKRICFVILFFSLANSRCCLRRLSMASVLFELPP